MSEQIKESPSKAPDYRPSLYADNLKVKEFSMWTDERLSELATEYALFLQRTDLMPRARAEAERVDAHLLCEMMYRFKDSLGEHHE